MVLVVMHSRASRLQFWSTEVKVEGGSLGKRSRDMDSVEFDIDYQRSLENGSICIRVAEASALL